MILARLALLAAFLTAPALAEEEHEAYPFERFEGSWTLKDDRFEQIWDGATLQTLSIPGHRTDCARVNTGMTILCQEDAVDFKGHILWALDQNSGTVAHLSHFGTSRLGDGTGSLDDKGNLTLSIRFSDEPEGTYRVYRHVWLSDDAYVMFSTQYDSRGQATGNWYGGTFVRIEDNAK
ncbi:hypothetical protein [Erythrobacter sp. YT30]|uniref:hypothetical protein n=1 Tax=Erythrobacter sp. YT30 TaxID=1735012 RepID=UPI00076C804F|nr:hypothetical protein [Erythrobacter sp. YT30]KWV92954.1 hypothetical protein AUC45_02075 [Erythrobacter sp. YT30]